MEQKQTSQGWAIATVVLFLLALPLLYVLSIGPAEAYFRNEEAPAWVVIFYAPLGWLANQSEMSKEWLLWYINLWS